MLSILESAKHIGGMIGRSVTSLAVPIPGAGAVVAPVGAKVGEVAGSIIGGDNKDSPKFMKDSVKIYQSGDDKNTSLSIIKQIQLRNKYAKKAKELGYNKVGQVISAVDPLLISLTPKKLLK